MPGASHTAAQLYVGGMPVQSMSLSIQQKYIRYALSTPSTPFSTSSSRDEKITYRDGGDVMVSDERVHLFI